MTKWPVFFLLLQIILTPVYAGDYQAASTEEGLDLAQKIYDRPRGDDASSTVVMILQGEDANPRQRIMYSYAKDKGSSERWTLLRFIEPKDIAGTGLLTLDYKGDDSDQWLYLPALDRVRRIASSRRGGRFVGSDFYYEDLMDREVEMDHHRILGKGLAGEIECDILESTPVDPKNSVYSKRISWIDPELLIPLKVDLYQNSKEEPVKRLEAGKIEDIQGYWTVLDSTMHNLETGHQTQLATKSIIYDQELPDELFTRRGLAEDTIEKAFRP